MSLDAKGVEPRLVAARIDAVAPALRTCIAAGSPGWTKISANVDPSGALIDVHLGAPEPDKEACVKKALAGVTVPGVVAKGAAIDVHAAASPRAGELPAMHLHERLQREDDGTCVEVTDHPCAPNKHCMAPTRRDVACPAWFGLPARPDLSHAERRLDLEVSGGKSGQGSERVLLWVTEGRCAIMKIQTEVGTPPLRPDPVKETSDVPCDAFDKVWALASKKLRGAAPKGDATQVHSVTKTYAFWTRANGASEPTVVERSWTGPAKLDEAFTEVAQAAGAISKAYGSMRMSRFEP